MKAVASIRVGGLRPYDVVIGRDTLSQVPHTLAGADRAVVIHTESVRVWADQVMETLAGAGIEPVPLPVSDAEAGKTVEVALGCWTTLGERMVGVDDAVVGVGGGAVTDLAGFVASQWRRGIRWVAVPTTLLAMVDAAIGGKTAINISAGKNLVGAFHPPEGVVVDLTTLRTLTSRDFLAGYAEVVKYGFIDDPVILDLIQRHPEQVREPASPVLAELVERSVNVKTRVVTLDTRDHGPREVLNYGHTLGHAIERHWRYRGRHGDAVSVGMVFAAELARLLGRLDEATVRRHREILTSLELPVTYQPEAWPALLATMDLDKKIRSGRRRLVILDSVGRPAVVEDPPDELLRGAYAAVSG